MTSFYDRFPAVSLEDKISLKVIKWAHYISPSYGLITAWLAHQPEAGKEIINFLGFETQTFILIGIITFILLSITAPISLYFIKKSFQKEAYLRKYGTHGVAIFKKGKSLLDPRILEINGKELFFRNKIGNDYSPIEDFLDKAKDGENIRVIYNPDDEKDFVIE